MIPIPFMIGAALGAGTVMYLKRKNKETGILDTVKQSANNGAEAISEAAAAVSDTVKSTVETIQEKNEKKHIAREAKKDKEDK